MRLFEIKMPAMGDVGDIVVTEVLVRTNQPVAFEQPLITVETDLATMQLPSPRAGIVHEIRVAEGDKLRDGALVVMLREARADEPADGQLLPATVPVVGDLNQQLSLKVIELLVRPGDVIQRGQTLVTLEADDFLVDVPSEYTGVVREMKVRLRDRITPGAVILMVEETQEAGSEAERANSLSATIHKK